MPVARLRGVLVEWDGAPADQKRLEAAWVRLEREAVRSAGRQAEHLAHVDQRRRKSRTGTALS
jgi:hypothetical protein